MREQLRAARVGVVVLIGLFASYSVYRYIDDRGSEAGGYRVYALFEDAQGLIPQSRVVIAGIPVGTIQRIRLSGERARIDIRINADVPLYRDATISMKAASLLGEKVLVISPGSVREPRIPDQGRIMTVVQSVGTDEVLQNVNEIAENVKAITHQLRRSFGTDEAGDRLQSSLRNLSDALETINVTIQTNAPVINRTLANVEAVTADARPRLASILENVDQATTTVNEILNNNRPDVERGIAEVDDTIASIHRASEQLETVLADVRQVTDRTARGEGTIGRLTSDDALIDEVEGVAEGLNDVLGGIGRLRTIVELRTEYNFLANTAKTYFSLRLQPREGRYFMVQLIDDPRGSERYVQTLVRRSPAPAGEPGEYQETRITRSRDLRFSIMLAKRVSFATFRFGILESTGGLGLDIHLFRDRFELATEVFAISEQQFPRLRARLAVEVVRRFWMIAGIDDALNANRDFFLGLQLRFDDEDLKGILPFVGGLTP
jgi:phospholipid/cholesterol/gamma-HCH transport system substrate-binding protein